MKNKRKKFRIALLFAFLASFCAFSSADAAVGDRVVVISPLAATTDSDAAERDDEVLYGMTGEIVRDLNASGLYQVRTQYNYTTWIHKDDLLVDTAAADAWRAAANFHVAAPLADAVPTPGTQSYPPTLVLPRGSLIHIPDPGESGTYFTAKLHDGSTVYIRKPSVRPIRKWGATSEAATRASLVEDAESYLGTAYRWGGKTPRGIDCSGFASMVYMLNGLDIYRNSRAAPGYPVALMHIEGTADGKHTLSTLSPAKPGDMLYWSGHQGVYIGGGKYIHSNGSSFNTRVNSLIEGDPDYRADLAAPSGIYSWGTAFPEKPDALLVKQFRAVASGDEYLFYGKVEGYAPDRGVLYPEGKGAGKPEVAIGNPRYMLYDNPASVNANVPRYTYPASGTYYPAVEFTTDTGWNPDGTPDNIPITAEFTMTDPVVVGDGDGSSGGCSVPLALSPFAVLGLFGLWRLGRRRAVSGISRGGEME